MRIPRVELLWWEGCPSTEPARDMLRLSLDEVGLGDAEIWMRQVKTDAEAEEAGFVGSPTILIDGADVQAVGPDEPAGLTCRVYRRRDGRLSPLPDPEDLRDALLAARDRQEVTR